MNKTAATLGISAGLLTLAWFLYKLGQGRSVSDVSEELIETVSLGTITIGGVFANQEGTENVSKEVDILARTIYGEARNEGQSGMIAVANVIMNRVKRSRLNPISIALYGRGVIGVCQKKWQFSCWLPMFKSWYDKNYQTAGGKAMIANYNAMKKATLADGQFAACLEIAKKAIAGQLQDTIAGSTHYLTRQAYAEDQKAGKKTGSAWSYGEKPVAVVGNHYFFNENQTV